MTIYIYIYIYTYVCMYVCMYVCAYSGIKSNENPRKCRYDQCSHGSDKRLTRMSDTTANNITTIISQMRQFREKAVQGEAATKPREEDLFIYAQDKGDEGSDKTSVRR